MTSEHVKHVAAALEKTFKARVSQSAGQPFDETGVTVPSAEVWNAYALSACAAIELFDAELLAGVMKRADLP